MSETSRIKHLEKLVAKYKQEVNDSWQDIDRMYLTLERITKTHADSGTLKKIAQKALYKLTKENKYDSI